MKNVLKYYGMGGFSSSAPILLLNGIAISNLSTPVALTSDSVLTQVGSGVATLSGLWSGPFKITIEKPTTSFRYYRVKITTNAGTNYTQFNEWGFFTDAAATLANRVLATSVTGVGANTVDSQDWDKCNDTNSGTKTGAFNLSDFSGVFDFGSPKTFLSYNFQTGKDTQSYIGRNPTSWTIEGSNDNAIWTMLDSKTNLIGLVTTNNTWQGGWVIPIKLNTPNIRFTTMPSVSSIDLKDGTLDIYSCGYATPPTINRSAGATVIQAALPTHITTKIVSWYDTTSPQYVVYGIAPAVQSLVDRSGNNRMASQTIVVNQPILDTVNSELTFTTLHFFPSTYNHLANAGWAVFAVSRHTAGVNRRFIDSNTTSGANNLIAYWNGHKSFYLEGSPSSLNLGAPGTVNHIYGAVRRTDATANFFMDADINLYYGTSNGNAKSWHLNFSGENSTHAMREKIECSGDLTLNEADQLYAYIAYHNSLQVNLPTNSPYKSTPPKATITDGGASVS